MIAITLIATSVVGIAMTFRHSRDCGLRISPFGLTVSLLSAGCLVIGEIVAHTFPVYFDDSDQSGDPFSGVFFLDAPSTIAMGLNYGGALLIAATPFVLFFTAITRYYRNKNA
jgi:hypothetical protein